jgi:hypothetical protein
MMGGWGKKMKEAGFPGFFREGFGTVCFEVRRDIAEKSDAAISAKLREIIRDV